MQRDRESLLFLDQHRDTSCEWARTGRRHWHWLCVSWAATGCTRASGQGDLCNFLFRTFYRKLLGGQSQAASEQVVNGKGLLGTPVAWFCVPGNGGKWRNKKWTSQELLFLVHGNLKCDLFHLLCLTEAMFEVVDARDWSERP